MAGLDSGMLADIIDAMVQVAPNEGCGLLFGQPETGLVRRFVPITNSLHSPTAYRLDDQEYLTATRTADEDGFDIVGVVHSHPQTSAVPSTSDLADARAAKTPPGWLWLIVSLAGPVPRARGWRIVDGNVTEVKRLTG